MSNFNEMGENNFTNYIVIATLYRKVLQTER